jgi:hypothetical protein
VTEGGRQKGAHGGVCLRTSSPPRTLSTERRPQSGGLVLSPVGGLCAGCGTGRWRGPGAALHAQWHRLSVPVARSVARAAA